MGNTVLTYFRKMKHPDMVMRAKQSTAQHWYSHVSSGNTGLLIRQTHNKMIITMTFKNRHEIYDFTIKKDVFYAYRRFSENSKRNWENPLNQKIVAELESMSYNDLESAMFQQSLVSDFGMFGAQEAEVLLQLRNIYFGDALES